MIDLKINGRTYHIDVDPMTPLLWAIREQVGLTGTKFGCGIAQCGACTVHLNGLPIRSCVMPVKAATGKEITTVEGITGSEGGLHPVQKAWISEQVPQCGYCQSGQIMAAVALLSKNNSPTDSECSMPLWPSMIMPMLTGKSPPPSGMTNMPSSRAARMTHCR